MNSKEFDWSVDIRELPIRAAQHVVARCFDRCALAALRAMDKRDLVTLVIDEQLARLRRYDGSRWFKQR